MADWRLLITHEAKRQLSEIMDARIRDAIKTAIMGLRTEPEQQGKPLTGDLEGYRSLRAVGQRYRIIFKPEREKVIVYIVAVGIRKDSDKADVFEVAHKLLRAYQQKQTSKMEQEP